MCNNFYRLNTLYTHYTYFISTIILIATYLHTQLQFHFIDSSFLETLPFYNRPRQTELTRHA